MFCCIFSSCSSCCFNVVSLIVVFEISCVIVCRENAIHQRCQNTMFTKLLITYNMQYSFAVNRCVITLHFKQNTRHSFTSKTYWFNTFISQQFLGFSENGIATLLVCKVLVFLPECWKTLCLREIVFQGFEFPQMDAFCIVINGAILSKNHCESSDAWNISRNLMLNFMLYVWNTCYFSVITFLYCTSQQSISCTISCCVFVGDATGNMHLQNLQGLAALANAANSPGMLFLETILWCQSFCSVHWYISNMSKY